MKKIYEVTYTLVIEQKVKGLVRGVDSGGNAIQKIKDGRIKAYKYGGKDIKIKIKTAAKLP